nr:unnamed protein product [Callosobruchus chinensis]
MKGLDRVNNTLHIETVLVILVSGHRYGSSEIWKKMIIPFLDMKGLDRVNNSSSHRDSIGNIVHHHVWGSPKNDSVGQQLVEAVAECNMVILTNGEATRISRINEQKSAVDITFVSETVALKCNWRNSTRFTRFRSPTYTN